MEIRVTAVHPATKRSFGSPIVDFESEYGSAKGRWAGTRKKPTVGGTYEVELDIDPDDILEFKPSSTDGIIIREENEKIILLAKISHLDAEVTWLRIGKSLLMLSGTTWGSKGEVIKIVAKQMDLYDANT